MIDWEAISREHGPLVWRTARRLLGNEADAADCFQETFVSAVQVARRQEVRNWGGLLQRLATTRALDGLRRRKTRARHERAEWLEQVTSAKPGPAQEAESGELLERLRAALSRLPEQLAAAFCLRELNGLSYEDIAAELRMTVDSVGVALHRSRAKLREELSWVVKQQR